MKANATSVEKTNPTSGELLFPARFASTQSARDRFNFGGDAVVSFAAANHGEVRGHTLVWHREMPEWLCRGEFYRDARR